MLAGVTFPRMATLGDNVRRLREARGWSQDVLATKAGTTQTTVDKIERGFTRRSRFLLDISKAFGVSLGELDPTLAGADADVVIPHRELAGSKDLPIFAATEGGMGAFIIGVEPIDYVLRPAPLQHVREGYGVLVIGDSMIPVFRPGDVALVHPLLPPRFEDVCIFLGENGRGQVSSIKEYVGQTETTWRVKRYQPEPAEFVLSKADWPVCHVVVGRYSRR